MTGEAAELFELRRHLHRMTVLQDASTRIVSALDPEEVVRGVQSALSELFACRTSHVHLLDPDSEAAPAMGDSTLDEALRERHTVSRKLASGALEVMVPLVARGHALGTLELTLAAPPGPEDLGILQMLAASAAVALHNAHLYRHSQRLATTDPLTGVSNYRHFHELLALEVQRARRMHYAVGLLMLDLDHFKLINDHHGHPAGDRALQDVADLLRNRLRQTDVVARVGGEEFAVILPGDDLGQVAIVAEKLRKAVEELPPVQGSLTSEPAKVTLSIGGASLQPEALDPRALIDRADRALYAAKRHGRNQVRLSRS